MVYSTTTLKLRKYIRSGFRSCCSIVTQWCGQARLCRALLFVFLRITRYYEIEKLYTSDMDEIIV
ncbi:unnamed protein product [Moneuplotes crassus]|uniref:Uncharacterized protein n=1 Tax=Euplotes crassus TaxID=5936 RepID=A0AAD1Y784_EUPCR|nr:unnamed protein product [Moneuplotes crassus]